MPLHLDQAFKNFVEKRAKYPRYKRKYGSQSNYHCSNLKITANTIKIPKIRPVRSSVHQELIAKVKSIPINRSAKGKYYAFILCDNGIEAPEKSTLVSTVPVCTL